MEVDVVGKGVMGSLGKEGRSKDMLKYLWQKSILVVDMGMDDRI